MILIIFRLTCSRRRRLTAERCSHIGGPRSQHASMVIPPGTQDAVRAFYGGVLGLEEKQPPHSLAHLHLVWFAAGEGELAAQIVLSGLARTRYLPVERLFHYERERLIQEEERLRQAVIFCQGDLAALQAQIEVIHLELSFLN